MGKPTIRPRRFETALDPMLTASHGSVTVCTRRDGHVTLYLDESDRPKNVPIEPFGDIAHTHQEVLTEKGARALQAALNELFPDTVLVRHR